MAESKFDISKKDGVHKKLADMAGEWEGISRVWFEYPGEPVDQSPVSGKISVILDGRFIMHEYKGSMEGNPLEGIAIIGYQIPTGKYQTAWVDSFHNGTSILFSESKESTEGKPSVLGSFTDWGSGQVWGWKTEIEQPDADDLIITMYVITPDGAEAKGVEITYKRKK
jgi:hypothetical protein